MSILDDIAKMAEEAKKQQELLLANKNCYVITVDTSPFGNNSGTDANISFQISYKNIGFNDGKNHLTWGNVHRLSTETRKAQTATTIFVENFIDEFHKIYSIKLMHDNSGNKPGWKISTLGLRSVHPDGFRVDIFFTEEGGTWIAFDEPGSIVTKKGGGEVESGGIEGLAFEAVQSVTREIVLMDTQRPSPNRYTCNPLPA